MRHRKSGVKLNRNSSHRNAMFRNMVTSLFKHDKIRTTDAKAKELRKWADSMVTLAKRGDLHARRQALSVIQEKDVVHKLFDEAQERFGSVAGGYTRITKIGLRSGDAASISLIELVTPNEKPAKKKKKAAPAAKAETVTAEKAVEEVKTEAAVEETTKETAVAPEVTEEKSKKED